MVEIKEIRHVGSACRKQGQIHHGGINRPTCQPFPAAISQQTADAYGKKHGGNDVARHYVVKPHAAQERLRRQCHIARRIGRQRGAHGNIKHKAHQREQCQAREVYGKDEKQRTRKGRFFQGHKN